MDLFNKFQKYLEQEDLIKRGERLLLAVSGGPDSLTMLDLFYRFSESFPLGITVFHLNHEFRPEAAEEAEFVEEFARERDLESIIESHDVPRLAREKGLSPEEAARRIRFELLIKSADKYNIEKIALAHNKDDLVETVLFNIFRGAGLKGLRGILPSLKYKDKILIHPLLEISRSDIEKYCQYRNLNPRRDPTNEEPLYTRNKIRNELIPYIEREINSGVKNVISNMAAVIQEQEDYFSRQAETALTEVLEKSAANRIILKLNELKQLASALRKRVIQKAVYRVKKERLDLYSKHLNNVNELVEAGKTGNMLNLPGLINVYRDYESLIIAKGEFDYYQDKYDMPLEINNSVRVPGGKVIEVTELNNLENWRKLAVEDDICICDFQKVNLPVRVRNRRRGDKFQPLGMEGTKKLKDYFIDEKIPAYRRQLIPLIIDDQENIIWIAGHRMNENYKVTDSTKKMLKITLKTGEGVADEK